MKLSETLQLSLSDNGATVHELRDDGRWHMKVKFGLFVNFRQTWPKMEIADAAEREAANVERLEKENQRLQAELEAAIERKEEVQREAGRQIATEKRITELVSKSAQGVIDRQRSEIEELRAQLADANARAEAAEQREKTLVSKLNFCADIVKREEEHGDRYRDEFRKVTAELARVRAAVEVHSRSVRDACAARDCDMYRGRGLICPECPTEFLIDIDVFAALAAPDTL